MKLKEILQTDYFGNYLWFPAEIVEKNVEQQDEYFTKYGEYVVFKDEENNELKLVADEFWLLKKRVELGLHKLPEIPKYEGKPIHFTWYVSGSDSYNHESYDYNTFIFPDGNSIDMADNHRGQKEEGLPSFYEVCIALDLNPNELEDYTGGCIEPWDKEIIELIKGAGFPENIQTICYGGSEANSLYSENEMKMLLDGEVKCQLRIFYHYFYANEFEEEYQYWWLFPGETVYHEETYEETRRLFKKHTGKELEN